MDDSAWMDEIAFQEDAESRGRSMAAFGVWAQFSRRGGLCGVRIQGVVDGPEQAVRWTWSVCRQSADDGATVVGML